MRPEVFQDDRLYEAEVESGLPLRIAFLALRAACDRNGRFEWRPRLLKVQVMPYDDLDFEAVLLALERHGFLTRSEDEGRCYGHLRGGAGL